MGYPTDDEMLRAVHTPPPQSDDRRNDARRLRPDGPAMSALACEALEEAERAAAKFAPFNSAHEGFSVALEEGLELAATCDPADPVHVAAIEAMGQAFGHLFVHVMCNQGKRDLPAMRKEAIQVAAMGLRFAHDVVDGGRGRV